MINKKIYINALKRATPAIIGLAILLLLFLIMSKFILGIILIAATILSAWGVKILALRWSGFELATLTTLVFGFAFGPIIGGIVGFITITAQLLIGGYMNTYILWVVPGYVIAGVIAGSFTGANIATIGVAIMIAMNLTFITLTSIITTPALAKYLPYATLNIIINYFLLTILGQVLMQAMG